MILARPRVVGFWLRQWAHTSSIGVTRRLVLAAGDGSRYLCVGGYPKSGTTWISNLVGACLALSVPRNTVLPLFRGCVVHHHWAYHPRVDRSLYVVRDGRDVMASEYVAMMNAAKRLRERRRRYERPTAIERAMLSRYGRNARLERRFRQVFGTNFDPQDDARNFPRFVEASLEQPFSEVAAAPWPRHVEGWLRGGRATAIVRYEEMLEAPRERLASALDRLGRPHPGPEAISRALERFDFARMTGRPPGVEDRDSFARRGVAGDWTRWFDRETARRFDRVAGDLLVELGYAGNRRWFEEVPQGRR